jgi:chromosomal replication initiator protein
MEVSALWSRLVAAVASGLPAQDVEVWLERARPLRWADGRLTVEVPNSYYADWISENYLGDLEGAARDLIGPIEFVWTFPDDTTLDGPREDVPASEPDSRHSGVNATQTFDSFVIGECNKLCHAAAWAVSEQPAKIYNPLFMYGATGLGKTHLMHAVANRALGANSETRVIYVTVEDFMNEMINDIRYKRMEDFRGKYRRRATILLVDDVQFLSGRERTQEEFFHTFNALQSSGRQIVLTADVPPDQIDKLEPRLRTRFEGGLLADLSAPDRETLLAILRQKADQLRIEVPSDLADQIANTVKGNIRSLEGVLKKLAAIRGLYNEPITLANARRHLPNVFEVPAPPRLSVSAIVEAVARLHGLRSADLLGPKKTRTLTRPRQIAMFLARRHTQHSFPELGREFGDREHSTIQHVFGKVEKEIHTDQDLSYKVKLIEQALGFGGR